MRLTQIAFLILFYFISFGQTTFVEDTQNEFKGIDSGQSLFADIDNDGDQDIFILGYADGFQEQAKFYRNDGNGQFEDSPINVPTLGYSAVAFADVDNDGDLDILLAGQSFNFNTPSGTFLFLNDGVGNFSDSNVILPTAINASVGFADVDNDNDQDILITGFDDSSFNVVTDMYINDGSGNYTLSLNEFSLVYQGEFAFADVDGDSDLDVLITGTADMTFEKSTILYENDGQGNFTKFAGSSFVDVNISSVDFGDIDGDGDEDLLLTGASNSGLSTSLYINNGSGQFTLRPNTGIMNVIFGDCSLSDVDLDGDLDILIIGRKGAIPDEGAKLYINDGLGNFTEDFSSNFGGATAGSVDLADVDGDGDLDAFIIGLAPDESKQSKLYRNELISSVSSSLEIEIKLFPNPTSDFITLKSDKHLDNIQIDILNSSGQIVSTNNFENISSVLIPTSAINEGTYFLKITDHHSKSKTISFVKTQN